MARKPSVPPPAPPARSPSCLPATPPVDAALCVVSPLPAQTPPGSQAAAWRPSLPPTDAAMCAPEITGAEKQMRPPVSEILHAIRENEAEITNLEARIRKREDHDALAQLRIESDQPLTFSDQHSPRLSALAQLHIESHEQNAGNLERLSNILREGAQLRSASGPASQTQPESPRGFHYSKVQRASAAPFPFAEVWEANAVAMTDVEDDGLPPDQRACIMSHMELAVSFNAVNHLPQANVLGKCDPYVTLSFFEQKFNTAVHRNCFETKFDETFIVFVHGNNVALATNQVKQENGNFQKSVS